MKMRVAVRAFPPEALCFDTKTNELWLGKGIGARKRIWSVTVDGSFYATWNQAGENRTRPSAGLAVAGALVAGTAGAVVGASVSNRSDTRTGWIEIKGDNFHELVEARSPEAHHRVVKIAVMVNQAAIRAGRKETT